MQKIYEVLIKGKGGHASMPKEANNPILIAAGLILQLCTTPVSGLENREVSGIKIVSLEAGKQGNIIPEQAKLKIGVYAQEKKEFQEIKERFFAFAKSFIAARRGEGVIREISFNE